MKLFKNLQRTGFNVLAPIRRIPRHMYRLYVNASNEVLLLTRCGFRWQLNAK